MWWAASDIAAQCLTGRLYAICWCRYNIKQKNFPKELFEVRMYVLKPQQQ